MRWRTTGELVIVERPGTTNLYFVAWQGKPLGGTCREPQDRHDLHCPLRNPDLAQRCARQWPDRFRAPTAGQGSGIPEPSTTRGVSDFSDPQGSDISEGRGQETLTQKTLEENDFENTAAPAAPMRSRPTNPKCKTPSGVPAHGFAHSERLPDHHPDCWVEASQDPEGVPPIGVRLASRAKAGLSPIAQVLEETLTPEGTL